MSSFDSIRFMPEESLIQIVNDYDEFERTAVCGDNALRAVYDGFCAECGSLAFGIATQIIAFEAARILARRYMATLSK